MSYYMEEELKDFVTAVVNAFDEKRDVWYGQQQNMYY